MWNKLKKFYPVEKIFMFLLFIMVLNRHVTGFPAFLAIVMWVMLLNRFDDNIRRYYDDTLKEYVERIMEGEDENEDMPEL